MEELPVKGISFDGYVMLNGQICLDGEKQLVYDFPIAAEDTKRMIAVFEEKKIPVMLVGQNRMYINFVDEKVRAAQKAISTAVPKVGSYNGENVYQFIVYDSEGKVQQLMENLTDCKENVWNPMAFDIIPKRGGKAAGIRQILELWALSPPVPTISNNSISVSTFVACARIAAAQPAISSVVSTLALFVESAARNAAFCVAVVSPLIISFITAYASL